MPKIIDEKRLFETVIQLLVDKGFDGMTTKDIALKAGINEATLFRRYESKTALVIRSVNFKLSDLPLTSVKYTGEIKKDLADLFYAYRDTIADCGDLVPLLFVELKRHRELKGALESLETNWSHMKNLIEAHQKDGSLCDGDPHDILIAFLGPLFAGNLTGEIRIRSDRYIRNFLYGYG